MLDPYGGSTQTLSGIDDEVPFNVRISSASIKKETLPSLFVCAFVYHFPAAKLTLAFATTFPPLFKVKETFGARSARTIDLLACTHPPAAVVTPPSATVTVHGAGFATSLSPQGTLASTR